MFGWLHPKCPVASDDQHWIEWRMTWLADQFGLDRMRRRQVILPTDEFFPEPYEATADGVRTLLDRVVGYMDVDPKRIDLDFYSQRGPVVFNTELIDPHTGAAGIHDHNTGHTSIWLDNATLSDPQDVIATLARELARRHLLVERRCPRETADLEPRAELLMVFFGFGVFAANAMIREFRWRNGDFKGWRTQLQGYLTDSLFGYALALFASYRGEASPTWTRYLPLDMRSAFKRSVRFLERSHAPRAPQRQVGPAVPPGAFRKPKQPPEGDLLVAIEEGHEPDPYGYVPQIDPESADGCVCRGVAQASQGQFEEALCVYSRAIELDPMDAEVYVLRGQVFLRLERFQAALSDGIRAVRLEPDDVEARRLRGRAHLQTRDPDRAMEDFTFVLRKRKQDADAYYQRGQAHVARRDFTRAVADYGKAIRYEPITADYYLARAEAYQHLGQRQEALADAEEYQRRASRLAPD